MFRTPLEPPHDIGHVYPKVLNANIGENSLALPKKLPPPPGTPPIRTQKRGATILPNFVGLKFAVHNGKTYQEFVVTENMVGRKLGEFAPYVVFSLPSFLWAGRWQC